MSAHVHYEALKNRKSGCFLHSTTCYFSVRISIFGQCQYKFAAKHNKQEKVMIFVVVAVGVVLTLD